MSGAPVQKPSSESTRTRRQDRHVVALLGNPNTGKSTLFTALTGTRQKIANYPGVTVEAKLGTTRFENTELTILDLPGTYSLAARSPDERVATEALLGRLEETPKPDGVILVVDSSSLDRNLYLTTQVLEFGLPSVIALTMVDVARARGIEIDVEKLSRAIGVPVVEVNAPRGEGLESLRATLHKELHRPHSALKLEFPEAFQRAVESLHARLVDLGVTLGYSPTRPEAMRLIVDAAGPFFEEVAEAGGEQYCREFELLRTQACGGKSGALIEAQARYGAISTWTREARTQKKLEGRTLTDRIDSILTHRVWGTGVFLLVMGLIFQSIYSWSTPMMDLIETGMGWLGAATLSIIPPDMTLLRSLVEQGVFGGVAGVLVFLPQILILFLFIAVLEDVGYMSRAAFLMDRLMSRFGLSGKSFIPLLSSFACNVPAIMGARVIEDRNTRLTTIFLAPFMSCSARLPVYTLMIGAFVPSMKLAGFIELQGLVLFAMYWVGIIFAIPTALILKRGILKSKPTPFLMELPSYKWPGWRNVMRTLWDRGFSFVRRAGTIIFAVSILIWALSTFPRNEEVIARYENQRAATEDFSVIQQANALRNHGLNVETSESGPAWAATQDLIALIEERDSKLASIGEPNLAARAEALNRFREQHLKLREKHGVEAMLAADQRAPILISTQETLAEIDVAQESEMFRQSYLARMGKAVEPAFVPLGWDWRIGVAAIASFPAREVVIGVMGTIFNVGDADEESEPLKQVLRDARRDDGTPLFTLATGLSIMVFFALCCQCAATLAVMRRETNSWLWPLGSFLYMTGLAYVAALAVFQIGRALGG